MLRKGDVFALGGRRYRVAMVNECRAFCLPIDRILVEIRDRFTGRRRQFRARDHRGISVSPESEVEILKTNRRKNAVARNEVASGLRV